MLLVAVAVVVIAVAGFAVYRLHGIFGSYDVTSTPSGAGNDIVPFNPKRVVMEVFGPPGTVATITQPAVFVNVSAQATATRSAAGSRSTLVDPSPRESALECRGR